MMIANRITSLGFLCLCTLLACAFASQPVRAVLAYDLIVIERELLEVCTECRGHGLGEVDGQLIVYATLNADDGNLLAYAEDGSVVEMAPELEFSGLNEADGSFVAISSPFFGDVQRTAIDFNNPGVLINPEDTSTGVRIDPLGVNSNGSLVGNLDGLVSAAFTEAVGSSTFLPGPAQPFGIAFDINSSEFIVVGESSDSNDTLDLPTLWEVDENLQVTDSFFLGRGEGQATIIADTIYDPEATVIYVDSDITASSSVYLKSTAEIIPFGAPIDPSTAGLNEILAVTPNAFLVHELSSDTCTLATLGIEGFANLPIRRNCVDATTIGDNTYVLFRDGTVRRYTVETPLSSNASFATALLPSSRSVEVGDTATAFFTAINTSTINARRCQLFPRTTGFDATFFFQATDPATNAPIREVGRFIDIAPGAAQSFVFGFTLGEAIAPQEIGLSFSCENAGVPTPIEGLSTLLLSASDTPVPDVIALAATVMNDGIVRIDPATGGGAFSVASVNVGDAGSLMVSADTGSADLPVDLAMCQTNPTTGACMNPAAPTFDSVSVTIGANETPTFAVFASSSEGIALDPANSRVFVRFTDDTGASRGATSVAVTR